MNAVTNRVDCPHGRDCGACALLGESYEEQLWAKGRIIQSALAKHPELSGIKSAPCLPSPLQTRYRNRAKMAVGISKHGGTSLGYFRAGTREIIDAPECRVLVPELLETTRRIRRFLLASKRIPRTLRHIDLRCGTDPMRQHLTLVFRATARPAFPLNDLRRACSAVDGISYNLNPAAGPQTIRGAVSPWWGEREIWVEHADHRLRVSPAAFFQVNLALLPAIHERMQEFLGEGGVLADLYAGVGTHGLALRRRFRRLFFTEGSRSAVADLKSTLERHRVEHAQVSPRAVERGLGRLRAAAPDAVVLNPSRAGVLESVLEEVSRTPARKLAYLSCDPTTLCRDLAFLCRKKFEVRSIEPIDMMPQTRQVEVLALLVR